MLWPKRENSFEIEQKEKKKYKEKNNLDDKRKNSRGKFGGISRRRTSLSMHRSLHHIWCMTCQ